MTDTSSDFSLMSPEQLSELLEGYTVHELVSSKVTGAIYKGTQISLDREVSIKILPKEIGENALLKEAFQSEAIMTARLNDPNVVEIYDFGDIDGTLYVVSEDVPGRTLHETTLDGHVEQLESTRLVLDICKGLSHAHKQGVMHKGLTPHNILLNNAAEPKIVDFGIAALFKDSIDDEVSAYKAPEIDIGYDYADHRADIYSVGIIYYELIVGSLPPDPFINPSEVRDANPKIDEIILKAINPDPNERYLKIDDMVHDLDQLLIEITPAPSASVALATGAMPSMSRGMSRPRSVIPPTKQSSGGGMLVFLLILAVIGGIVFWVINNSSTPPPEEEDDGKPNYKYDLPEPPPV